MNHSPSLRQLLANVDDAGAVPVAIDFGPVLRSSHCNTTSSLMGSGVGPASPSTQWCSCRSQSMGLPPEHKGAAHLHPSTSALSPTVGHNRTCGPSTNFSPPGSLERTYTRSRCAFGQQIGLSSTSMGHFSVSLQVETLMGLTLPVAQ